MTDESMLPRKLTLTEMVPTEWFSDPDNSSFWLRIYSCVFVPHSEIHSVLGKFFSSPLKELVPVPDVQMAIAIGTPDDLKLPFATSAMGTEASGQVRLEFHFDNKPLPQGVYVFMATPYLVDGRARDESSVRTLLDQIAALICLHGGMNVLREQVFDGEVSLTSRISYATKGVKMPQPCEGPFPGEANRDAIAEIADAIRKQPEDRRRRLLLALTLIDSAMRQNEGFFEYWTALEVVTAGKVNRVKSRIGSIYGIRSHHEAGQKTGFNVLASWRHRYTHEGIRPPLTADIERYLQLMFLDLLRNELSLPSRGYLAQIQQAAGYDLSALGLADRRPPRPKGDKAEPQD